MTISFKQAEQQDFDFLLSLRKQTMTPHLERALLPTNEEYHVAQVRDAFDKSKIIVYKKHAIGLLKLGQEDGKFHIIQIQILPEYQRKGIGAHVLKLLIAQARRHHAPITLNVLKHNPAIRLYQRSGFKIVGETTLEYQMTFMP